MLIICFRQLGVFLAHGKVEVKLFAVASKQGNHTVLRQVTPQRPRPSCHSSEARHDNSLKNVVKSYSAYMSTGLLPKFNEIITQCGMHRDHDAIDI